MTSLMEPRPREKSIPASPRASVDLPPPEEKKRAPVPLWRRVVPALALAVIVMCGFYATSSFTFAGAIECRQHGLSGARPAPGTPAGTIIGDMNKRCADAGNSRIAVAGVTAVLAAVIGVAGVFAPTTAEVNARRAAEAASGGGDSSSDRPTRSRRGAAKSGAGAAS